jgi:hypothetical protein
MKFRLVYEGELRSSQRDPIGGQTEKTAEHKHKIRKHFHRQLKHLWESDWFLSNCRVWPQDYGASKPADGLGRWAPDESERVPLIDVIAQCHRENGYRFVPLVRDDWKLLCNLEILFLRHDPPGSVYHAGDLDNRIKTLIDALRKPHNANELRGNENPAGDENPFFVLLEDDKYITGLTVESDRFLVPPAGNKEYDQKHVHIVLSVDVRPYNVTNFNQSFVA